VVEPPPAGALPGRPHSLIRRSYVLEMSGEENPASKPTPVQDVHGDGRWMSLVSDPARGASGVCRGWGTQENSWSVCSCHLIGKPRGVGVVLPEEGGRGVCAIDCPLRVPAAPSVRGGQQRQGARSRLHRGLLGPANASVRGRPVPSLLPHPGLFSHGHI
jgi:hypothetical protein